MGEQYGKVANLVTRLERSIARSKSKHPSNYKTQDSGPGDRQLALHQSDLAAERDRDYDEYRTMHYNNAIANFPGGFEVVGEGEGG